LSRLLHLRSGRGLYGADRALLSLARHTPAPLRPVVVNLTSSEEGDPLVAEAGRWGLASFTVPCHGRLDARAVHLLASELRRLRVRLLHTHDYKALAVGLAAGRLTGVPVVATFHGDTGHTPAVRGYEALARGLANLTSGVSAVSRELVLRLQRWVWGAPVVYLPNALPAAMPCTGAERFAARAALGLAPDVRVLAVVARLSPEKGHRVLLEALRSLVDPPMLVVAGDGPLRGALMRAARGLPVRWLGYLPDVRPVYAAADAVVLPSFREGLPLVALEAALFGRPLVASAVGELPYLLGAGRGLLVPPGRPAWLSAALSLVLGSAPVRLRMARALRAHVLAGFDARVLASRYVNELYAPVLRDAPGAARRHG
jgi:glycosyltransferase involved in cell wall biosynthesis